MPEYGDSCDYVDDGDDEQSDVRDRDVNTVSDEIWQARRAVTFVHKHPERFGEQFTDLGEIREVFAALGLLPRSFETTATNVIGPLDITCPNCCVPPGRRCVSKNGVFIGGSHVDRERVANRQSVMNVEASVGVNTSGTSAAGGGGTIYAGRGTSTATSVKCPTCKALIGRWCVSRTGRSIGIIHKARRKLTTDRSIDE